MMVPTDRSILITLDRSTAGRAYIRATVGLCKLGGNESSYWTATAELYEPHGTWSGLTRFRNEREFDAGGTQHELILRVFPRLAPFVALHLADARGVPMHAVANGRYFIEQGDSDAAARHFRCKVYELPDPADVEAFVLRRRGTWLREAEAAYALLLELRA